MSRSARSKFLNEWTDIKRGLRTLASRNAILIIIVQISNQYGNNMKNAWRSMVGINTLNIPAALIGVFASLYLIVALVMRAPYGVLVDKRHDRMKHLLIAAMIAKSLVFIGYGLCKGAAMMGVLFFLDGFTWAFAGVCTPAMLALIVDRRILGSAYAVFQGLTTVITAFARPMGVSVFKAYGPLTCSLITASISLIPICATLLMDGKKLAEAQEDMTPTATSKRTSFIGRFASVSGKMLPIALVGAIPYFALNAESTFLNPYCAELGFTQYLTSIAAGQSFNGVFSIVVGVLCDIINPAFFIFIGLTGQAVGLFLMGVANSEAMMATAALIYAGTRFFGTPLKIFGMKMTAKGEQGQLSGIMLLCADLFSVIASTVVGFIITGSDYGTAFRIIGIISLAAPLLFIYVYFHYMKKMKAPVPNDPPV